jgi:hypothetical protein
MKRGRENVANVKEIGRKGKEKERKWDVEGVHKCILGKN